MPLFSTAFLKSSQSSIRMRDQYLSAIIFALLVLIKIILFLFLVWWFKRFYKMFVLNSGIYIYVYNMYFHKRMHNLIMLIQNDI